MRRWITEFAQVAREDPDVDPNDVPGLPDELRVGKTVRSGFAAALGGELARYVYFGDGGTPDGRRSRRSPARIVQVVESDATELSDEITHGCNNPWATFQYEDNPYFRFGLSVRATFSAAGQRMRSDDGTVAERLATRYDEVTSTDPSRLNTKVPIYSYELLRGGELVVEVSSYLRCAMVAMARNPQDYPTRRSRFERAEQALLRHLDSRGSRHVVDFRRKPLRRIDDQAIVGFKEWTDRLGNVQRVLDMGDQPAVDLEGVDPSPLTIGCMMRLVKARRHDNYSVFDNSALAVLRVPYEWPDAVGADLFDFEVAKAASDCRQSVPLEYRSA